MTRQINIIKNFGKYLIALVVLVLTLNFIGCKKDTPTTPVVPTNHKPVVVSTRNQANFLGTTFYENFHVTDEDGDTITPTVIDKTGALSNYVLDAYFISGDLYQVYSTTKLNGNTGPATVTVRFSDGKDYVDYKLTVPVERFLTEATVYDGVNTPSVRICNEDYGQWSNGLTEYDLGGSPYHWQKHTDNDSEKQLVSSNFKGDSDTGLSQSYNSSDVWQKFVDAISTGNYHVGFDRYDYTQ